MASIRTLHEKRIASSAGVEPFSKLPPSLLPQHPVLDRRGELIGAIVEWLVDPESQGICYAVILVRDRQVPTGAAEQHYRLLPLPWSQLHPIAGGAAWRLEITANALRHAADHPARQVSDG